MLLTVRIITIICISIAVITACWLIIAGLLEVPVKDTGAIWIGCIMLVYYAADCLLLYRSYKRKHAATHWVAFVFSLLPVLAIGAVVILADTFDN